jgi:hypothetical protein
MALKKIAINAFHSILFEILEEHLQDAFKVEGITSTNVEIFRLTGIYAIDKAVNEMPKDEPYIFVFASYGMGMWSGSQINAPLNAGAHVIIWCGDQDYLNHMKRGDNSKNLSLYYVGLPKNPDDNYNKASDHLAQEIAKRIKASQS